LYFTGVSKNVLLDKDGTYYSNNRLKELLIQGGTGVPGHFNVGLFCYICSFLLFVWSFFFMPYWL
jgi:hypothetical protein